MSLSRNIYSFLIFVRGFNVLVRLRVKPFFLCCMVFVDFLRFRNNKVEKLGLFKFYCSIVYLRLLTKKTKKSYHLFFCRLLISQIIALYLIFLCGFQPCQSRPLLYPTLSCPDGSPTFCLTKKYQKVKAGTSLGKNSPSCLISMIRGLCQPSCPNVINLRKNQ
ncbi:hypothetical protein ABIB40_002838 [Pedobacter sp. UYP30]